MQQLYQNGNGITAFAQNVAYTSAATNDFLRSGCRVVPNVTNTSGITVDVESGSIALDSASQPISIASQSVELSPVPAANNSDPNRENARIDVIELGPNGASVVEGSVGIVRPNATDDGASKSFPQIWEPAPDDGGLVSGIGRAVVCVRPSVSDSTDITQQDILNYDAFGTTAVTEGSLPEAIADIPQSDLPLQTTAQSATTFGGRYPNEYLRDTFSVQVPNPAEKIPAGETRRTFIAVPTGHEVNLRRVSVMGIAQQTDGDIQARVVLSKGFGPIELYNNNRTFSQNDDGSPIASENVGGGATAAGSLRFEVKNTGNTQASAAINATFFGELVDGNFTR